MKLLFAALLGLLALQSCSGRNVKLSASSDGLDEEETAIVNGFLELIQGVVAAGGDLDAVQDLLSDIKHRVEKKLRTQGAPYLHKLAATLTKVYITEDNVNKLVNSIHNMAAKDGVTLKARSKRSPEPKKKKKKKGKKGKKGGKMGKMKGGKGCGK